MSKMEKSLENMSPKRQWTIEGKSESSALKGGGRILRQAVETKTCL